VSQEPGNIPRLLAHFRFYLTPLLTAPPGRLLVIRVVVGDPELTPTARVDGVDLVVLSVVARVGYLAGFTRKGSFRRPRLDYNQHHYQKQPHCH
jgi:hypothetical protein